MAALILLQRMLMLFAMMMIGYFCYKKAWIDDYSYGHISKIVINVANPLLIIDGVINKEKISDGKILIQNVGMMILYFILLIIISLIVSYALRVKKTDRYLYQMMMVFSNVGFMGIPVITGLYGDGCTIYIAIYLLGYNAFLYTYGLFLAGGASIDETKGGEKFSIKKLFNIGVIACIVAIVAFAFNIRVPDAVKGLTSSLGNTAIPFSMMLIGASLAKQNIKELFGGIKLYIFLIIKLLVVPIIAALLLRNSGLDREVLGVFCLLLSMPVGSIVVLFAKESGADEKLCTRGSVISTLASVATIPIVALFLPM